jgi:hypothetical protein
MRSALVALAIASLSANAFAGDQKLSLAELKALVGQSAYKEAFLHLGDISPTERKADWIDVASAACGGVLATVSSEDGTTIELIDEIDRDYPQLVKAPKYARPRAELGKKGLEACFAQQGNCLPLALRFVDNASDDRGLALAVAKLARQGASSAGAVPLFKRALGGKDKSACKDDDAKLAIIAGLDQRDAADAKALMVTCWDSVKDDVVKAFDGGASSDFQHNTCEILIAKNLLSPLQIKVCNRR